MRVCTVQFAPELAQVALNIAKVDKLIEKLSPNSLDLLVLPELAFTGYNFPSLQSIEPFLEPTAAGPSARWASSTATRLQCVVVVGYPEKTPDPVAIPKSVDLISNSNNCTKETGTNYDDSTSNQTEPPPSVKYSNFNSTLTVSPSGEVLNHYRKTQLYYTDATWALPSPTGFQTANLPLPPPLPPPNSIYPASSAGDSIYNTARSTTSHLAFRDLSSPPLLDNFFESASNHSVGTATSFGICMDFSPRAFTAPWTNYELARHTLSTGAKLLLGSMAWLTSLSRDELLRTSSEPDWDTLFYWIERLRPLLVDGIGHESPGLENSSAESNRGCSRPETLVVISNRAGIETGGTKVVDLEKAQKGEVWEGFAKHPRSGVVDKPALNDYNNKDSDMLGVRKEPKKDAARSADPGSEKESDQVAGEARYAGTSVVMALGKGTVSIWKLMGRAEEGLLVVDTAEPPSRKFISRQSPEVHDEDYDDEDGSSIEK